MGVNFYPLPVMRDKEALAAIIRPHHDWLADWLIEYDLAGWLEERVPGLLATTESRYPTTRELRQVAEGLEGPQHRIVEGRFLAGLHGETMPGWSMSVYKAIRIAGYPHDLHASPHALLLIDHYTGNENDPQPFYFEKGDYTLNMLLADRIASICGPLILWSDAGESPGSIAMGTPEPLKQRRHLTHKARVQARKRR